MARKKLLKLWLKVLLFIVAPVAFAWWWFRVRMVDKFGNTFALGDTQTANGFNVLINGSGANGAFLASFKKRPDGTMGGTNAKGAEYYWDGNYWRAA